jgi:hypothetical protein
MFLEKQPFLYSINSQLFNETYDLLSSSQQPATGPYHKPDESTQHLKHQFLLTKLQIQDIPD